LLQPPADKPHGLRECTILCSNGYAWVASRRL
ncbi:MAG: glyoxalase, partial [Rhodobacteraceae bacterium]|nr:glyoxalase [Paracoccaceae bacterium]